MTNYCLESINSQNKSNKLKNKNIKLEDYNIILEFQRNEIKQFKLDNYNLKSIIEELKNKNIKEIENYKNDIEKLNKEVEEEKEK